MRGGRIGIGFAVLVLGAGIAGAPVALAAEHDANDVQGPIDIADASFDQHKTNVSFEVHNRGALPSLKELTTAPTRVNSADQRYLCLQLQGPKVGRNLYCPGGKQKGSKVTLGHLTYGKKGTTKPRDDLQAKVSAKSSDSLRFTFSQADAELSPGKVSWSVVSGWTGEECQAAAPTSKRGRRAPRSVSNNLCLDRQPDSGFVGARIYKLRLAGCTSPGGEFSQGPTKNKQIALTFDDGPSTYTNSVIKILDSYGAHSTFFEIGEQVSAGTDVMRKALNHGHELANHSYHHENLPGYDSLKATSDRIEDATGFRPCEFRPPYGAVDSGLVSTANSLGMSTILWDVDTRDWTLPGSGSIYSTAVSAGAGSIVLMHDGGGSRSETVAALPDIIETLQGRGYELVTVTELLGGKFKLKEVR